MYFITLLGYTSRREPGLGKRSDRGESLINEDKPNEWRRIRFIKDLTESKVLPQLFLAIVRQESLKTVEGLVVGLYPRRHKPYAYQRLGRGRCSISGLIDIVDYTMNLKKK